MGERRCGNYSFCCRLCLTERMGTLKPIFEDNRKSDEVVRNIRAFVGVDVNANDKLSTMICNQCVSKLEVWQDFKKICCKNQTTLVNWLQAWNANSLADVTYHIKDEVVNDENIIPEIVLSGEGDEEVQVKSEVLSNTYEPESMEEDDSYDAPPPLIPNPANEQVYNLIEDEVMDVESVPLRTSQTNDSPTCHLCNKTFTTVSNRRKHEAMMHRKRERNSRSSNSKQDLNKSKGDTFNKASTRSRSQSEMEKIQFAAGLQLQKRSKEQIAVENMPLTKVEISYLEKCKALVSMEKTKLCPCHSNKYGTFKELSRHVKKQRLPWYALYTCYNCLIIFGSRSSYMKHVRNCPRQLLQRLKRLSELPVNPEIKMRIYQNFKCIKCNCVFSFHEDFCSHFDQEHMEVDQESPPFNCQCSRSFDDIENYKQHLHITCFLRYFCDVCFQTFSTTDDFKEHCEKEHDNAEGESIEAYDYYYKCKYILNDSESTLPPSRLSEPIIQKKEAVTITRQSLPVKLDMSDQNHIMDSKKVINPVALHHFNCRRRTSCPSCDKDYSSFHNMLRHFKNAHDQDAKILKCAYCEEQFKHVHELRNHELNLHSEEVSAIANQVQAMQPPEPPHKFSCPECGMLFKNFEAWTMHMEVHPKKVCDECGEEFALQSELNQHRNTHLNIKVYKDAETQDYKSTIISPSKLICQICDKVFANKMALKKHKMLHERMPVLTIENDLSKKYPCTTCNRQYASYTGLWEHNRKHHPDIKMTKYKSYKCNLCPKVATTGSAFASHLRMHERLNARQSDTPGQVRDDEANPSRPVSRNSKSSDDSESYYTCKKCFKVFSVKSNYRNHLKCHGIHVNSNRTSKTGKVIKTYWCNICHEACSGYESLQQHKQEHVKERMLPSVKTEMDVEQLQQQVQSSQKQQKQQPPKLQQQQQQQKKPIVFSCDVCGLEFSSNFVLKRHREKHAEDSKTMVYCKYCKIPFKGPIDLSNHMVQEHDEARKTQTKQTDKESSKKFPCSLCKKVFDHTGALSSHLGWHKRGKVEKRFRSQGKLLRTMVNRIPESSVSAEENQYQCYSCSKTFVNDTTLQIHILETHRNINATVLNCDHCKTSFQTRAAYDLHMQTNHSQFSNDNAGKKNAKAYSCKLCPAAFGRSDALNGHMKQHHKEYQDTFKCNQCDRVFEKQNALALHLKVHDKHRNVTNNSPSKSAPSENVYFCSICDVGFAVAKDLRNHVVFAHPFQ